MLNYRNNQACKVMLRNCKVNVVAFEGGFCYDNVTTIKEDFVMKLQDKIIKLRKEHGWSQEDLAEKMYVSRQAISRWENGTAQPDAQNVLQISKLFCVTTDYLLNDDYESDSDIPIVQTATQEVEGLVLKKRHLHLISAIAFSIAAFSWLIGGMISGSNIQFVIFIFLFILCIINAVIQYALYFKKR